MMNFGYSMIGDFPYVSRGNPTSDFFPRIRDNPLMREDLTKEYVDKIVLEGFAKFGSQSAFERAIKVNKQYAREILDAQKCPPADVWQRIEKVMGIENKPVISAELDIELLKKIARDIEVYVREEGKIVSPSELILAASETYNSIVSVRKKDRNVTSNAAMVSLALNKVKIK